MRYLTAPLLILLAASCGHVATTRHVLDRNGRLRVIVEERAGQKDGMVTYYEADGTMRLTGRYEQDVRQGWWRGQHATGRPSSLMHFEQGLKEGTQCYWGRRGTVTRVETFVHGEPDGTLIDFLEDGRPVLWTHKRKGKAHGPHYHWWFKEGRTTSVLMGTFSYSEYDGRWLEADTTGQLFWLADYDQGRLVHTWVARRGSR